MTTIATLPLLKDLSLDWIKEFSSAQKDPDWLAQFRIKAFQQFSQLPWPDKKSEKWKRVDWKALNWDQLKFAPTNPNVSQATNSFPESFPFHSENEQKSTHYLWDFTHGRNFSSNGANAGEVKSLTFEEAALNHESLIRPILEKALEDAQANKFWSLSLALGNGGLCLILPKNKKIESPIIRSFRLDQSHAAVFPIHLVIAESGSQSQIWEELLGGSTSEPSFVSSFTLFHLKDNAHVSSYHLQHWNEGVFHFQFQTVNQEAHTRLQTIAIQMGGRAFRNESILKLAGVNSENKVLGILFGEKEQQFENWITQNHTAPKTISDIQIRGALKGKAKSFFSGMVAISKEAQQSDAYQSSKSLILSKEAQADAIPNLEILADDVKCAHGAAVGPVDEDQKYYLQTRGLTPEMAEKIIIEGFFDPVVAEVPFESTQESLRNFIEEKLQRA